MPSNSDFDFKEELKKLPNKPGVYIMHDAEDTILYVGKAINLHNRVRSYFKENIGRGPQIDKMVSLISYFEYIVTDSELEALVLENNLIKEHRPKYNTMLKDDKTYPYIKITVEEDFPRVLLVRQMKKDKARYFGPYMGGNVKETIDLLDRLYKLRTCNRKLPQDIGKERACLNYHMGQCNAPCQGYISSEDYKKQIDQAIEFLNGKYQPVLKDLREKMLEASEKMEYEEAMKYRDLMETIKKLGEVQKISDNVGEDKDIIALAMDGNEAVVQVFFLRNGKLIGREHFYMTQIEEPVSDKILSSFVKQFYAGTPFIPREVILQENIEDIDLVSDWLTTKKGNGVRVKVRVPKIGDKEKLVELAAKNAQLVLSQDRERIKREEGRTIGAVKEIEEILGMENLNRMEAFDISNTSGFANVASMVVFEKGKAKRSDYRKFKMKTVAGPDDYACMHEALTRRFKHGLEEKERMQEEELDESFGSFTKFPDLLLMDGGRGQVNVALQVLKELNINIPVCGMVKDDNHNTRGLYFNNVELPIDTKSEGFKLITRIQDEAHRFAITYHRSLRSKAQVHSVLDEIPGVGPTRRKNLMKAFSDVEDLKKASAEEIASKAGIPLSTAKSIEEWFSNVIS